MVTTIQISDELQKELSKRKLYDRETYEEVIWGALEDSKELSDETIKHIAISEKEIAAGKTVSLDQIKARLGIKNV
ncbi:hypothetical protein KY362_06755 [Candidatus Woesearchaeota archaeon]|nr:hypothetical protein [Candidatus Woesearchaeota archaeon]